MEQQLEMFADCTSCNKWWPSRFRLLPPSLAYVLTPAIRHIALGGIRVAKPRSEPSGSSC